MLAEMVCAVLSPVQGRRRDCESFDRQNGVATGEAMNTAIILNGGEPRIIHQVYRNKEMYDSQRKMLRLHQGTIQMCDVRNRGKVSKPAINPTNFSLLELILW